MSLESALEEERQSVLKLLEEQHQERKRKGERSKSFSGQSGQPKPTSLVLDEGKSSHTVRSSSNSSGRRPVSLLLDDGPVNKRPGLIDVDSSDPHTDLKSYYYTSSSVRSSSGNRANSSSLSPTSTRLTGKRPSLGGRTLSSSSSHVGDDEDYSDSDSEDSMDYSNAYRQLSNSKLSRAGGSLGELYRGSAKDGERLEEDEDDDSSDEDVAIESDSSDEEDDDKTKDDDVKVESVSRLISTGELHVDEFKSKHSLKSKLVEPVKKLKVKSLLDLDEDQVSKKAMEEYAAYKRRIIHPNTAFNVDSAEPIDSPYTGVSEEIMDAKRAAQLNIDISTINSNGKRMVRTMKRGELLAFNDVNTPKLKSFIVATDLSPEAMHALEWTIGTVLRDGNILYLVCAFEEEEYNQEDKERQEQKEYKTRLDAIEEITDSVLKLLKKTRLEIYVIIEVLHCKVPRHILTEIIDLVNPTLVILGSRGRSALKGVLLGSFSNYIVEKSSVPVMVARRKLQKSKNKGLNVRLANNLTGRTLANARID